VYDESDWKTPIIFILSKGADPTQEFMVFKDRFQKIRQEQYEEEQKRLIEEEKERERKRQEELQRQAEMGEEGEEGEEGEQKENNEEEANKENEEEEKKEEDEKKEDEGGHAHPEIENGEEGEEEEQKQEEEPKNSYEFSTYIISLGQGQEEEAKKAILEYGIKNGAWVLLQNCHLFKSFMPDLATIVQSLQQDYTDVPIEITEPVLHTNNTNTSKKNEKIPVQENLVNP
jgi:hypothetical protein